MLFGSSLELVFGFVGFGSAAGMFSPRFAAGRVGRDVGRRLPEGSTRLTARPTTAWEDSVGPSR